MSKPPAFGLQLSADGVLVPCEAEQRLLRLMQAWRRNGLTCSQVAALLKHGERVRSPRSGSWFTAREVATVLASARMREKDASRVPTGWLEA